MCNRYQPGERDRIEEHFHAKVRREYNTGPETVHPKEPGWIVRLEGGERVLEQMTWGFPLALRGKQGQPLKPKPVNNARNDKLHTPFWRASFEHRRCLIPVTAWAEAEGLKGQMTRTWYSLPLAEPFAVAGLWRTTDEWGDAYSMVMVDGSNQMAEVHDRMPLILHRDDWVRWSDGSPQEAFELCRTWGGELSVERSGERWAGKPNVS
jgi:putative SOS response-associated peptidase YedK